MLRRFRLFRTRTLLVPWWLPFAAWIAAGILFLAGAQYARDDEIAALLAGCFTAAAVWSLARQVTRHQRHHQSMDPQHDEVVDTCRFVYEYDGHPYPARLDTGERPVADVVRLRPRGGPRHSRPRRARRPSA